MLLSTPSTAAEYIDKPLFLTKRYGFTFLSFHPIQPVNG